MSETRCFDVAAFTELLTMNPAARRPGDDYEVAGVPSVVDGADALAFFATDFFAGAFFAAGFFAGAFLLTAFFAAGVCPPDAEPVALSPVPTAELDEDAWTVDLLGLAFFGAVVRTAPEAEVGVSGDMLANFGALNAAVAAASAAERAVLAAVRALAVAAFIADSATPAASSDRFINSASRRCT